MKNNYIFKEVQNMANMDYLERDYFEQLFEMSLGYILDFTNRTFQEFVYEKIQVDIYSRYEGLSKAKIMRRIMSDYNDVVVGKLLLELMRYMQTKGMVTDKNNVTFKKCAEIGNRLIGKKLSVKKSEKSAVSKSVTVNNINYNKYLSDLKAISDYSDTPQARGFAFEKYLNNLFEAYGLEPRGSFKIIGEQIDGSFLLHNEVYLLEAKWTNKKINKGDLVIFNEKVSSKSGFTRGLFISFSGFSDEALSTFSNGRTINIVLMTVQKLVISLSRNLEFTKVLSAKVRALAEEGDFNKSIFDIG